MDLKDSLLMAMLFLYLFAGLNSCLAGAAGGRSGEPPLLLKVWVWFTVFLWVATIASTCTWFLL